MCKAIAGDYSLSWLMGFEPQTFQKSFNARRLGALVKQYEDLRLENYFSPSVRRRLSAPNSEFTLEQPAQGRWQFRPVRHDLHKVSGSDVAGNRWQVQNPFARQPLQVRIEALLSLSPYDHGGEALATLDSPAEFGAAQSSVGVTGALLPVVWLAINYLAAGYFMILMEKYHIALRQAIRCLSMQFIGIS